MSEESPEISEKTVLEIILTKEGEVKVKGVMLNDEVACYGLLKKAEIIIMQNYQVIKSQNNKIIKPHGIMQFIRNGKH